MGEARAVVAEDAWSSRRRRSRGKPIAGSSTAGALASAAARSGTSSTFPRRDSTPRSPSNGSEELALLCKYL